MPLCVLDQLRWRVEPQRLAVQQGSQKGGRFVALDPRRHIGQQSEAGCVTLRETILAETADLADDPFGPLVGVAPLPHAGAQSILERPQATLAFPGCHRSPQLIGLAGREPTCDDGELHRLLLEDRHAQRTR